MPAITQENADQVTEVVTSVDDDAAATIRGNVGQFMAEDNTSMMGGWTN